MLCSCCCGVLREPRGRRLAAHLVRCAAVQARSAGRAALRRLYRPHVPNETPQQGSRGQSVMLMCDAGYEFREKEQKAKLFKYHTKDL